MQVLLFHFFVIAAAQVITQFASRAKLYRNLINLTQFSLSLALSISFSLSLSLSLTIPQALDVNNVNAL